MFDPSARQISVFVVSPSTQSQRSFQSTAIIADIKAKLELVTGISASAQRLALHQPPADTATYELTEGPLLAALEDNGKSLADYGVKDGDIIKVSTTNSNLTTSLHGFVDNPNVAKFELTAEEYASRNDTVMAYKARNKIGRFADESEVDAPLPLDLKCEARVKVMPTNPRDIERVGTIRYVGKVDFAIGSWVGIEYDEPVGKNDGTVEGKQYFQCQSKYGGFVKPERCAVRDWQSLDDELDFDSD